jgi:hypothetical protein
MAGRQCQQEAMQGVGQHRHPAFERALVVLLDFPFADIGIELQQRSPDHLGCRAPGVNLHPPVPQHDPQLGVGNEEPLVRIFADTSHDGCVQLAQVERSVHIHAG